MRLSKIVEIRRKRMIKCLLNFKIEMINSTMKKKKLRRLVLIKKVWNRNDTTTSTPRSPRNTMLNQSSLRSSMSSPKTPRKSS